MRSVPEFRADYRPRVRREEQVIDCTYRLLTPLFGGGVNVQRADPVTVVRATEVRGQLRFWWRAARAGGMHLDEMRRRESEIFGSASEGGLRPSALVVEVECLAVGKEESPYLPVQVGGKSVLKVDPKVAPGYLAFPLQTTGQPLKVGVRFRLRLRFPPDLAEEVVAALWAWERFGGVGSRTRRGFGAVQREQDVPGDAGAAAALMAGCHVPDADTLRREWERYVRPGPPPQGVPGLSGARWRVLDRSWREVAQEYRRFRQYRSGGTGGRAGRSLWPESTAVRAIRAARPGRGAQREPERPAERSSDAPVLKFPRAQFGLPIVMHFREERHLDTEVIPARPDLKRLASPLVFRPLSERQTVVLILNAPRVPPGGVRLKDGPQVEVELTAKDASKIPPLRGNVDPLLAFLESL